MSPVKIEHRALLALAALKVVLLLFIGNRYGFHRDELYYLVGGRHFELGYVDHPFLVPWLARLSESIFGQSLLGLRLFSTIASASVVYIAGAMAAQFGGSRRAQTLAATAVLLAPFHLMTQNLFQTVPFDCLTWSLGSLIVIRLLRTSNSRWWISFGVIAGVGLLTKYTFVAFGAAIVAGLILTPNRRELARPWIYAGGALALLLFLPNLLWQLEHGWPTLEFIANNGARNRSAPPEFLALQALMAGPFSVVLVVAGFRFLFSGDQRQFRMLGFAAAFVLLGFLLLHSKPYYTMAIYPVIFAAGAVWLESHRTYGFGTATTRLRRHWPYLLLLGHLLLLPAFVPILPVSSYARLHDSFPHPEFGEMFGWHELVESVGTAYQQLPTETRNKTVVLTSNYGVAGALDLFGAGYALPPALCFQNSYYYWSQPGSIDSVIAVGFSRGAVERFFGKVEELGIIRNAPGINNEEAGRAFFLASEPKLTFDELREELKRFH